MLSSYVFMRFKRAHSQLRTEGVKNINGKKNRMGTLVPTNIFPKAHNEREKETKEDENIPQVGKTLEPPPTPVPKISIKR